MGNFLRNHATPLALAAFAAIGISGVMMFAGLRTHELGELHEWLGITFVCLALLHIIRNGHAFTLMLARTRSKIIIGSLGTLAILLIGTAYIGGSHGHHGPDGGPEPWPQVAQRLSYTPISQMAPALGLSPAQAITRLRKGGISVAGPGQNLADISQKQGVPVPQMITMLVSEETAGN